MPPIITMGMNFRAARDDLLKIVDAIPGVPAQRFVDALERTVSDAASSATRKEVYKGMVFGAVLFILPLLFRRK